MSHGGLFLQTLQEGEEVFRQRPEDDVKIDIKIHSDEEHRDDDDEDEEDPELEDDRDNYFYEVKYLKIFVNTNVTFFN